MPRDGRSSAGSTRTSARAKSRCWTSDAGAKRLDLPQLAGGDPRPFEVVGIPLAAPGYHVVEIESLRLGQSLLDKRAPMYVRTGVLVTNLGVHFKLGRENSVVWVTTLDRGKPVEGADVAVNDCNGKPLWTGTHRRQGPRRRRRARSTREAASDCLADSGYFVTARKAVRRAGDRAAATTSPSSSAAGRRASSRGASTCRPVAAPSPTCARTTVFDRTLFRAGETVSMKHFVRTETLARARGARRRRGCRRASRSSTRAAAQEYVQPLAVERRGAARCTTWSIPPAAKLGVYEVSLERDVAGPAPARRRWRRSRGRRSWCERRTSASRSSACRSSMRASAAPKAPQVGAARASPSTCSELLLRRRDGGGAARASALLKTAHARLPRLRRVLLSSRRAIRRRHEQARRRRASDDGDGATAKLDRRQAAARRPTGNGARDASR